MVVQYCGRVVTEAGKLRNLMNSSLFFEFNLELFFELNFVLNFELIFEYNFEFNNSEVLNKILKNKQFDFR